MLLLEQKTLTTTCEKTKRLSTGPMLPVPVHPEDHRQGEGREAEAVSAPWSPSQGVEVDLVQFDLYSGKDE